MRCIFWSLWTAMYNGDRCIAHKVTVTFSPAIHHLLSHSNLDRSEFFAYKLYKSDHINRYQDSMRPLFWSLSTNDLKLNFLTIRLNILNNQIKIWKRLEMLSSRQQWPVVRYYLRHFVTLTFPTCHI